MFHRTLPRCKASKNRWSMYKACQHTRRLVKVAGIFHRIFRRRNVRSTGSVLASDPGYHVSSPEARAAPDQNSTRRSTVFPAPKSSSVVSPVLKKHRPRPLGGNSVSLQTAEARGIAL